MQATLNAASQGSNQEGRFRHDPRKAEKPRQTLPAQPESFRLRLRTLHYVNNPYFFVRPQAMRM